MSSTYVAVIVDSLEESELGGIKRCRGCQGVAHVLNGDVSVANDVARGKLLWRRVVCGSGVGEAAQLHVGDLDSHVEGLVGCHGCSGNWVEDDGGDHVGRCWDITHHDTIARTSLGLETVGHCLAGAEVDEVGVISVSLWLESMVFVQPGG